jgi:hypothetical protein
MVGSRDRIAQLLQLEYQSCHAFTQGSLAWRDRCSRGAFGKFPLERLQFEMLPSRTCSVAE